MDHMHHKIGTITPGLSQNPTHFRVSGILLALIYQSKPTRLNNHGTQFPFAAAWGNNNKYSYSLQPNTAKGLPYNADPYRFQFLLKVLHTGVTWALEAWQPSCRYAAKQWGHLI